VKTRKVNRYWCDFCNKGGLSAGHMRRHEASCTLNPLRVCRMCILMGNQQQSMDFLIGDLPRGFLSYQDEGGAWVEMRVDTHGLRERAQGCPACMMAALRQQKIPVPLADGFDYKTEAQSIFHDLNKARAEREYAVLA
jgi:hypothetical protein